MEAWRLHVGQSSLLPCHLCRLRLETVRQFAAYPTPTPPSGKLASFISARWNADASPIDSAADSFPCGDTSMLSRQRDCRRVVSCAMRADLHLDPRLGCWRGGYRKGKFVTFVLGRQAVLDGCASLHLGGRAQRAITAGAVKVEQWAKPSRIRQTISASCCTWISAHGQRVSRCDAASRPLVC